MLRGRCLVVALMLGASALAGCQPQPLGTTVNGEACVINLHAGPHSVHPGSRVTLRRAPGCDRDHAGQVSVWLDPVGNQRRPIGTATLGSDGAVTGTVVIPAGTTPGRFSLRLKEESDCSDTASCAAHPTFVIIRVR